MASEAGSEAATPALAPSDSAPTAGTSSNGPISHERLQEIIIEACDNTLQFADSYQHPLVGRWNTNIIQSALALLIKETTSYKFIVTSTVIQHTTPAAPLDAELSLKEEVEAEKKEEAFQIGRRGLHSATGAYWNNEKDGTWSYQYKGTEKKGFDVIATVFWIATT